MNRDLFGQEVSSHRHGSRPVDIFDLESDLSHGERQLVAAAIVTHATNLKGIGYTDKEPERLINEADRYAGCGKEAISLFCPDCRSSYYIRMSCRSRICERCGRIYKKKLEKKLLPLIKQISANKRKGYVLALLTLTVSSKRFEGEMPDRDDIKRLYKETSKFLRLHYGKYKARLSKSGKVVEKKRKKKELKPGQSQRIFIGAGWVATLELGADNNNAHCHVIIYGPIRQWHQLKSSWESITGDSSGVDIRKIHSPKQLTNYVLKYITKPPVSDSYSRIADYAIMIKGSRRLRSGGIFYNQLSLPQTDRLRCECIYCSGPLRMDGAIDLQHCGKLIDLYAELRKIKETPPPYVNSLTPEGFLPKGVTPVNMSLWQ